MPRLLSETKTVCYAWSLLDNHFHLLLQPTEQLLATFMRRLLTGYAVSFNLRHRRSGHLFQNRYQSIICDRDVYLLELIRYIHLNPVQAGKIKELDDLSGYRWCGQQQLLVKEDVLSLFARRENGARRLYLQFIADKASEIKKMPPSLEKPVTDTIFD